MPLWDKMVCLVSGRLSPGAGRRMILTGNPPSNEAEAMVKKIAGDRLDLPLDWLERRICHELYVEELRLTWYTADIGLSGREAFHEHTAEILREITPVFGSIRPAGLTVGNR